ncbi:conserved hypothetical protein [Frankia canadensis]|uniref:SMODS and SLOG-associating 2TM effector domain-containing protein n=1 Tax=Frankia canadensis TaxID=1836972 RepID=A0A2I2L1Z0_9ACTN|nr:DUF4231 domain-containing protein [Frankia canadensis]SNQ51932.1 conserved hypothetical protein [Frankia canadensis]SOU59222.1 conserved hypothetical protein [Frankia canadensis]
MRSHSSPNQADPTPTPAKTKGRARTKSDPVEAERGALSPPSPPDPEWGEAVAACRQIVDTDVRPLRERYRRRANRHKFFFRVSGLFTVLLGGSLPLLAGADFDHRDVALAGVGVTVAVLTGLREFYRWDEMWSLLRRTENALTDELLRWDLRISRSRQASPPSAAARYCYQATEDLLAATRTIRDAEADRYFGGLRHPHVTLDPAGSRPSTP